MISSTQCSSICSVECQKTWTRVVQAFHPGALMRHTWLYIFCWKWGMTESICSSCPRGSCSRQWDYVSSAYMRHSCKIHFFFFLRRSFLPLINDCLHAYKLYIVVIAMSESMFCIQNRIWLSCFIEASLPCASVFYSSCLDHVENVCNNWPLYLVPPLHPKIGIHEKRK